MTLPATDNFNGTTGASLQAYSASWTINTGAWDIQASTAAVNDATVESIAHWNADTFNNNQYSQDVIALVANNKYVGVGVRIAASSMTCYGYYGDNGTDGSYLFKYISGGPFTQLGSKGAGFAASNIIRLEANGTTLTPKKNGSTADIGAQTDSGIASGYAGITGFDDSGVPGRIDNWEGGNLAGAAVSIIAQAMFQYRRRRGLI